MRLQTLHKTRVANSRFEHLENVWPEKRFQVVRFRRIRVNLLYFNHPCCLWFKVSRWCFSNLVSYYFLVKFNLKFILYVTSLIKRIVHHDKNLLLDKCKCILLFTPVFIDVGTFLTMFTQLLLFCVLSVKVTKGWKTNMSSTEFLFLKPYA